jgi:hypothetical protein
MLKIGCSLRNINRLIAKYKSQGKKGFIHGNRDRKPANTTNEDGLSTLFRTIFIRSFFIFYRCFII